MGNILEYKGKKLPLFRNMQNKFRCHKFFDELCISIELSNRIRVSRHPSSLLSAAPRNVLAGAVVHDEFKP